MVVHSVIEILRTLLYGWLVALIRLLRSLFRRRDDRRDERDKRASPSPCVPIDDPAFVRPDPLIYSQGYLMGQGLAVTWDNPDIVLFEQGVPVPSHALKPDTLYDVRARIWNDSFDAPVFQMKVHLAYLDFGIGTTPIDVGSTMTDVGVKGGPNHPAFVSVPWRTPDHGGHMCLQVVLDPFDDRNGANNLGQENTTVGVAHSPVEFQFTLKNDTRREHRYHFETDAYQLGERDPCPEREQEARDRLRRHRGGGRPLPAGFAVAIVPETPTLQPGDDIPISVTITPPDGFIGAQPVNVNAFHEQGFAGGVTLTVVGEA